MPVEMSYHIDRLLLNLAEAQELAQENIRRAQERQKAQYDKKASDHPFEEGDLVKLRAPYKQRVAGQNAKLAAKWFGPYKVTELRDVTVEITPVDGKGRTQRVHVNRLQKFPAGTIDRTLFDPSHVHEEGLNTDPGPSTTVPPGDDSSDEEADDEDEYADSEFANGDYVWARMSGYPDWPARLIRKKDFPGTVKAGKRPVEYLGESENNRYGLVNEPTLRAIDFTKDYHGKSKRVAQILQQLRVHQETMAGQLLQGFHRMPYGPWYPSSDEECTPQPRSSESRKKEAFTPYPHLI